MAGITSGGGTVAQCKRHVPPRLEGRDIHKGAGKLVLTSVATGRSAGVFEEGRHVLVDEKEEDGGAVVRKQRKQARSATVGPTPLHGRLRSSRRTTLPRTAFVLPLPALLLLLLLRRAGDVDRG
jgi:hypothetical protein